MTVIIDYNAGNVGSIKNMLARLGEEAIITNNEKEIEYAERLILPGVGKFDYGMQNLENLNLIPILNRKVLVEKIPILGICLGVQLMTKSSEEGIRNGLGWFDAKTVSFNREMLNPGSKIPHMGWSDVFIKKDNKLLSFKSFYLSPRFYHVHSYHLFTDFQDSVIATTKYGNYEFPVALNIENIYGVQFHPEKSHKYGMELLRNFVKG